MRRLLFASVMAVLLGTGCQAPGTATTPTPVPTVRTEGQGVKCASGDHGIDEVQFGWAWCYPGTWKFQERLQPTTVPSGVDATFDIVNDVPSGQSGSGDFGFLIVGTYSLGDATTLQQWVAANLGAGQSLTPITWGNAKEAGQDASGHRFALTSHDVVEMDVRGQQIADEMSKRLSTWTFG